MRDYANRERCPYCQEFPMYDDGNGDESEPWIIGCIWDDCPHEPEVFAPNRLTAIALWNERKFTAMRYPDGR